MKRTFREKLNKQDWIIKLFAIIGAGAILYWSIQSTLGQVNFFYKHITRKRVIIIYIEPNQPPVEDKQADDKTTPDETKEPENEGKEPEGSKEENEVLSLIKKEFGEDWKTAYAVAKAESRLKARAVNVNKDGSIDRGIFQINSKWHPEVSKECAFSVACNIKEAKRISSDGKSWRLIIIIYIKEIYKQLKQTK